MGIGESSTKKGGEQHVAKKGIPFIHIAFFSANPFISSLTEFILLSSDASSFIVIKLLEFPYIHIHISFINDTVDGWLKSCTT